MFPMRVEKWGDSYRLLQLKGFNMGTRKRPRKMPYTHTLAEDEGEYWERRWIEAEGRLHSSVSRSRSRVKELAMCNSFEYFCTFTLCDEKQDRFDLKAWVKDLGNWIGNYNKRYNTKLEYLIIPEQHKNGAWHAHGLVKGISKASIITNKHGYLEIPYYSSRFGFMNMSPIRHKERCATYVSKYITKDTVSTARALGRWAHTFYASRGLEGKQILWSGYGDFKADFESPFCKIAWVGFESAMKIIGSAILALKDPYHTMRYTISKILNLEKTYDENFVTTETLKSNIRKLNKTNVIENNFDTTENLGGKNNEQKTRLCRYGELRNSSSDSRKLARPNSELPRPDRTRTARPPRRGRRGLTRGHKGGYQQVKEVLFQLMDESRHHGSGVQTNERTAREMIEAADRAHSERVASRQNQIAYATSQGSAITYFDYAHRQNHRQLTFFGMGNE